MQDCFEPHCFTVGSRRLLDLSHRLQDRVTFLVYLLGTGSHSSRRWLYHLDACYGLIDFSEFWILYWRMAACPRL